MFEFDKLVLIVRLCLRAAATAALAGAWMGAVHAQVPGNAADYTRTSSFTWQTNGALQTQTIEPANAASCSVTTYGYDAYGNRSTTMVANCSGAAGRAKFPARAASATYGSVTVSIPVATSSVSVTVPDGVLRATSTNALQQQTIERRDPRFGLVVSSTDPNGVAQSWTIDDFGRVTAEAHSDSTRTVYAHCVIPGIGLDSTSNSSTVNGDPMSCPSVPAGQAPADAVSFVQNELHNAVGSKIGPFTRTFYDKLGRALRIATEPFDGTAQPGALISTLRVLDTAYNAYGQKIQETQPYFLATQSSTTSGSGDLGLKRTDYDDLGRPVGIYVADSKGKAGNQSYGGFGSRASAGTTITYAGMVSTFTNDLGQTRVEEYDTIGELARVTDATGAQIAYLYDAFGNLITTRDALQNQIVVQFDLLGHKVQVSDPDKGVLAYCYDPIGQLKAQQTSKMRGAGPADCPNIDDVAADATGKTATQVSNWTTMAYDVTGRMAQRIEPESKTTWSYDAYANAAPCGAGIGRLCEVVVDTGEDRTYLYDAYGRPTNQRTSYSGGPSFASVWAYDASTQQLAARTYPTGLQVGYNYTARGFVQNVVLKTAAQVNPLPPAQGSTAPATSLTANSVLWTASAIDAWGVAENESFGNGVATATTYDPYTGRMASVSAGTNGNVLNQSYAWDSLSRMTSRADANGAGDNKAVSENFGYGDNVGRLTSYTVSAVAIAGMSRTVNLQYNALGMLLYKSDVGNYVYGAQNTAGVRPHALAKLLGMGSVNYLYDSDGNLASSDGGKYRALTYNSFDLPDSQTGAAGPGGTPSYKWVYDETHARLKETRLDASGTRTTWNLHPDNVGGLGFESETAPSGATSNRHYVSVAGHNVAVLVSTGALPSLGAGQMTPPAPSTCGANCITLVKVEYWHLDHLGSLISTTDHTGAVTQRYAYDPFGKRRGTDGNYDAFGKLVFDWSPTLNSGTDRGFTGHEHLDDIGLIHMNGRIFDPTLGVFLQADPHITDAGNLQSFNRYGYCLNNPLSCTDPSGFDGEPVGPPQTVNVCGNCNAGASDLNDGGSYDGGGYNSSPQWRPGMFKAAVRGAFGRSAQLQMMGLAPLDGAAAVKGFVNWWKATKNYLQHERAVKAAVIMLQGEGFKVLGTEEPALTPGMESYRKYDIVAVNPSGTSIVGIEIKSTEAVTFQLDPQQVAFDVKAVMQGATIFRGDNEGVRITSIMYVGMTMGAQQDANFQSTILRNSLTSANIPTRTMAYSSITQEVGSGK